MKRKIKALLKLHGITQNEMAEIIGVTYQTFSIKLNGHKDFYRSEILAMKIAFGLTEEEIDDIFFSLDEHSEDEEEM